MKILGLSTASKNISVGLSDNGKALADVTCLCGRSEELTLHIKAALEMPGISIDDIDGVAVAAGPGSYSGLRGGLAAAKAICQAKDLPLITVPTLDAVAYGMSASKGTFVVLLDAVRDEHNMALFASDGTSVKRLTEDIVMGHQGFLDFINGIKGEISLVSSMEVPGLPDNVRVCPVSSAIPKGLSVALIGEKMLAEGKAVDVMKASPVYSHSPKLKEYAK